MSDPIIERMEAGRERARVYLGDGLYASVDERGIVWLRTVRPVGLPVGGFIVHEVALDSPVLDKFGRWVKDVHGLLGAGQPLPEVM